MNEFQLRRNVPLASLTTLGVGGCARALVTASDADEVRRALDLAQDEGIPLVVLGGGSNVIVSDRGVEGLVLCYADTSCAVDAAGGRLHAGAGLGWDDVVQRAVEAGLAGIECLRAIPGAVGAAPVQNIGAYGQEIADTLRWLRAVDLVHGEEVEFEASECGFAYRDSHFKSRWRGRHLITAIELQLRPGGEPTVAYPSLAERLADRPAPHSLSTVSETVHEIRREKGMVYDGSHDDLRSAGSFFTNPVVTVEQADAARDWASEKGKSCPEWPADEGRVKLSAAWLIEAAGFHRGHLRGNAGLSDRHVLALVNRGGATAAELLALAREVKQAVLERFGVELVPEPVPLGFEAAEIEDLWPTTRHPA